MNRLSPANVLTICAVDPVAKIPETKVCAVRVSKLEGSAAEAGDEALGEHDDVLGAKV